MTDKERMLTAIIQRMITCIRGGSGKLMYPHFQGIKPGKGEFGLYGDMISDCREYLEPGDLVIAGTSWQPHRFSVGFVVEVTGYASILIREIGTNELCNYGNESFTKVVGLGEETFEKNEYQFKLKVLKAFRRLDGYWHLYGGLNFANKGHATLLVRERFGGFTRNQESIPYEIKLMWNKCTTIKEIARQMSEQGYGKRKFEKGAVSA